MVTEKVKLKENLDLVGVDQLVKELRMFPKTQVVISRAGCDVDGRDAIRLADLHADAGEQLTIRCVGREEASCLRAVLSLLG